MSYPRGLDEYTEDELVAEISRRRKSSEVRRPVNSALGWETISVLRSRADSEIIECQAVMSGRWKKLSNPCWDDCVILVPYRKSEISIATRENPRL